MDVNIHATVVSCPVRALLDVLVCGLISSAGCVAFNLDLPGIMADHISGIGAGPRQGDGGAR